MNVTFRCVLHANRPSGLNTTCRMQRRTLWPTDSITATYTQDETADLRNCGLGVTRLLMRPKGAHAHGKRNVSV